jgi:protein-L-isoaspartate(D-aspartate) O-methyltransferase
MIFPRLTEWLGIRSSRANCEQPSAGDELLLARRQMVAEQLQTPDRGITDARVLAAMGAVPRHDFIPENVRVEAYDDTALPIGEGQTISQPYIVAFMTEQMQPQPGDRVLEIGTGCGYQAAVLARLVREVFSVEIVEALAARAREDLRRLGFANVRVRAGDGHGGWAEHAPFDAVIVTCAPDKVPAPLILQLKEGGRMVIPVGPRQHQQIYLLQKEQGKLTEQAILPVRFVPMTRASNADV